METKIGAIALHWSLPIVPQYPSSSSPSQGFSTAISSSSIKKRSGSTDRVLVGRFLSRPDRSDLFGWKSMNLLRTKSCENLMLRGQTLRRACSDSFNGYPDEEFNEKIQELVQRLNLDAADTESEADSRDKGGESSTSSNAYSCFYESFLKLNFDSPWAGSIVQKAQSLDIPISLRIIKKKKQQWEKGLREAGESAYCSVKKAFSSLVFIMREVHSYTLQMSELFSYEELQEILVRVQNEMQASFVWLFQQVFSHTPTLMVSVMILLANFTVYSMANNNAIAAPPTPINPITTETVSVTETQNQIRPKRFDSSNIKTFSVSSSTGKTMSINGGNNGGGGIVRPFVSGTDGEDQSGSSSSNHHGSILPEEIFRISSFGLEVESRRLMREDELKLWNSIVEEASRMQAELRDETLDHETMKRFVSPVNVTVEPDDFSMTELLYQEALAKDPDDPLLLSNYAQFLYVVVHDHDRAEEYFRRATTVKSPDPASLAKFASFLWRVRNDVEAAENTYLEAIEAEPGNTHYSATYAYFLWDTGAQDTCYPLTDDQNT